MLEKKEETANKTNHLDKEQSVLLLHNAIWKIANDLRGSIDGWDFKVYVLVPMFYRYLSEHLLKSTYEHSIKDYSEWSDERALKIKNMIVDELGFFIAPSELFNNVLLTAKKEKEGNKQSNLNILLHDIFEHIQSSANNHDSKKNFEGLFSDFDTSNKKLGDDLKQINNRLLKLLEGISQMPLGDYTTSSHDAFGDAYEYLISMYASNAGKSGGEYFTPQEVSKLLMKLAMLEHESTSNLSIYDPACGSGSLLLQAKRFVKDKEKISKYCGQEINLTTYNLARMNMFLNGVSYNNFEIAKGDTLIDDKFKNKEFDIVVSNPPYSIKWEGKNDPTLANDERYKNAGTLAPASKADYAFVLTCLYHLNNTGTASIVCFPGIFTRSGAELEIRKYLVKNNFIDAVIQLPSNLFFGTSIPTCIIVLKKNKKDNNILFIDAKDEFVKATNKNKLTDDNINKIYETYKDRKDVNKFSKLVSVNDIEANNFNLAVNAYVDTSIEKEVIDIDKLENQIDETVNKIDDLRLKIKNITKEIR